MTKSALDDIPGLGETRRKRLLKELGGVGKVKQAGRDELRALPWLPNAVADAIHDRFHAVPGPAFVEPDGRRPRRRGARRRCSTTRCSTTRCSMTGRSMTGPRRTRLRRPTPDVRRPRFRRTAGIRRGIRRPPGSTPGTRPTSSTSHRGGRSASRGRRSRASGRSALIWSTNRCCQRCAAAPRTDTTSGRSRAAATIRPASASLVASIAMAVGSIAATSGPRPQATSKFATLTGGRQSTTTRAAQRSRRGAARSPAAPRSRPRSCRRR